MTPELMLAYVVFCFATAGTPGPNNMMLLASGANFGFRRTVLHILGISGGLGFMVLAMGLGLGGVFRAYPVLHEILKWIGAAYMLWLAWKIATSSTVTDRSLGKPMTFLQAAAFQWVNPKAWMMAVAAYSTYLPARSVAGVVAVALLFALVNLPCLSTWTLLGSQLRGWMAVGRRQRLFNLTMGGLLVLSLGPMLR